MTDPALLRTRPLFRMRLAVDPPLAVGAAGGVAQRIAGIPGGCFEGERLRGTVLAGGTDWQTLRGDGATLLDARIVLRTDEGALITMTYTGIRHGSSDAMDRLARGEEVDPAEYYFRMIPAFATSDPDYDWLNRVVAVATGVRLPDGPVYHVHEVL